MKKRFDMEISNDFIDELITIQFHPYKLSEDFEKTLKFALGVVEQKLLLNKKFLFTKKLIFKYF